MPDLPAAWIADPDAVTFAIWILAGSVILLGGMLVAGAKWITGFLLTKLLSRLDGFEDKLDRVANSLETLTLTTSVQIAEIKTQCQANHNHHQHPS